MAGVKIVDLPALGRDLISTDLLEVSLNGGGSRKITGQEIMNASKLAIGSTPIVSGTVGRLLFQGTGNVLSQSGNLFWDNTNGRLGVGTSSPTQSLDVVGIIKGTTSAIGSMLSLAGANNTSLNMSNDSSGRTFVEVIGNTSATLNAGAYFTANGYQEAWFNVISRQASANNKVWRFGNLGQNNYFAIQKLNDAVDTILFTPLSIASSTGNIGINTTTDAGYKLDVNGTSNFRDVARFDSAGNNKRVLISSNPSNSYISMFGDVGGYITSSSDIRLSPTTGNIWINEAWYIGSFPSIDTYGAVGIRGQNAKAMYFENNSNDQYVSGFVFNYSGSGGFNSSSGLFRVLWNNQSRLQMNTNCNLMINTSIDAGFRLDVNGTARVQGDLTIQNNSSLSWGNGNFVQVNNANPDWKFYVQSSLILTLSNTQLTFALVARTRDFIPSSDSSFDIGQQFARYRHGWLSGQLKVGDATAVNASAKVQIDSTTQGFLPPRMTNAQRAAIASPAVGLIVYCTDATEGLYVYKSTGWTFML